MAASGATRSELGQLWTVAKLVGLGVMVNQHMAQITVCKGPSMLPTMNRAGDVLFVDKLSFKFRDVRRNEIVIAASPHKPGEEVCKRVIGLPGDTIHVGGSHVRLKVPDGYMWLEGDNQHNSTDSRNYGPVPMALLRGRVAARVWPVDQVTAFSNGTPRPADNDNPRQPSVNPLAQTVRKASVSFVPAASADSQGDGSSR